MHLPRRLRGRLYLVLAGLLAVVYSGLWSWIAYSMERTFNLRIWDVGAVFVLTNFSAPPGLDYGHLDFAPQSLIYLLFTPLVRGLPDPMTLAYAQDGLMGAGGIVIFLLARFVWQSESRALVVEGLYLFNYALFGAPFYPNHYEILFSVFFPLGYYFHLRQRPAISALFLVLAAASSSLGAIMVGLFGVLLLGPRLSGELRGRGVGLRRFLGDQRYVVGSGVAAFAIFLLPFLTVGPATALSYAHLLGNPSSPNLVGGTGVAPSEKLVYLALLYAPYFPIIGRSRYSLLIVPYVILVAVAGNMHYSQFAYQYTYAIGACLFVPWIESLRGRYARMPWPRKDSLPGSAVRPVTRRWRLPPIARAHPELLQAAVIIAGLGCIVLPYSPGNAIAGPYLSLPFHDYHFPALVSITAYDRALYQMSQQIPIGATVLIQEDMPMLTNRATWYEPGSYNGEPVDFALTDPVNFWFIQRPPAFIGPYATPMINWTNSLLATGAYGIVEEYDGAILLEGAYRGPVMSFVPYKLDEPGTLFTGPTVSYPASLPGAMTLENLTNQFAAFHSDGPLILPPGKYSLTVWLATSTVRAPNHLQIGLWSNSSTPVSFQTIQVTGNAFPNADQWTAFGLNFTTTQYDAGLYLAAYNATWAGQLSLRYIALDQTSPG